MAFFRPDPAVKRGTLLAAMVIDSPVRGLRPSRAPRSATWNLPNPVKDTALPPFSESEMTWMTASTAAPACFLSSPDSCATWSTKSPFVTVFSAKLALHPAPRRSMVRPTLTMRADAAVGPRRVEIRKLRTLRVRVRTRQSALWRRIPRCDGAAHRLRERRRDVRDVTPDRPGRTPRGRRQVREHGHEIVRDEAGKGVCAVHRDDRMLARPRDDDHGAGRPHLEHAIRAGTGKRRDELDRGEGQIGRSGRGRAADGGDGRRDEIRGQLPQVADREIRGDDRLHRRAAD